MAVDDLIFQLGLPLSVDVKSAERRSNGWTWISSARLLRNSGNTSGCSSYGSIPGNGDGMAAPQK